MKMAVFDIRELFTKYIFFASICIAPVINSLENEQSICKIKSCSPINKIEDSVVFPYCKKFNWTIVGRCCLTELNKKIRVVAADLSSCDLKNVSNFFPKDTALQFIALHNNSHEFCPSERDFTSLTSLETLTIPNNCSCPGGKEAWEVEDSNKHYENCSKIVNLCQHYNLTCPANSDCIMNGPGRQNVLCNCDKDHYGYKCMRTGVFPGTEFGVAVVAGIAIISGFLYLTQRRHAITRSSR